jgi:uncharacterized membrane protein
MSEKDLQKLLQAGIIDHVTADKIKDFFEKDKKASGSVIITIFASIGALLFGGGIILILAHNWDRMSEYSRVLVAITPLAAAQILAGFTLYKKQESDQWREASGVLLFLAMGATLATLGQIYQLPADTTSFLKVWVLTGIPILYLLRSHTTGVLLLVWIFLFMVNEVNYGMIRYWHWVFMLLTLPFYLKSYLEQSKSRVQFVYNWLGGIIFIVAFLVTFPKTEDIILIILAILTGFYHAFSKLTIKNYKTSAFNSWHHLAQVGTLILCYLFAFKDFWKDYKMQEMPIYFWFYLSLPVLFIIYKSIQTLRSKEIPDPPHYFWLIALLVHFFNPGTQILFIFFNILFLWYGIYYTYQGIHKDNLYQTNLGLLSIIFIITTRFFDFDMSFMMRGIAFIIMGVCFFAVNYFLIKTKKS